MSSKRFSEPEHSLPPFVGARYYPDADRAAFCVWAPFKQQLWLELSEDGALHSMRRDEQGYFDLELSGVRPGAGYFFVTEEGRRLPDPASRFQPAGVHGPSAIVDTQGFVFAHAGYGAPRLHEYVIYELHLGTFTPEGSFAAAARQLPRLAKLGVTAVELLPVAAYAGERNWGYDGVQPYAVQACYGGPDGLAAFVDAAHEHGMAVVLDVVYNHLGPEGNYLREFGPYFTTRYQTPWGEAINFDGPDSDEVREYFIRNALYWLESYDIDALRLDAVHAIYDTGARPFLAELQSAVDHRFGGAQKDAAALRRPRYLIAESDMNDSRLIRRPEEGGYGLAGQWADDFHHAVHVLLTGEQRGYYADFGELAQLQRSVFQAYNLSGGYSQHRRRRHGNSPHGVPPERFVVCIQNHDQVGNRMLGERLSELVSPEQYRFAVALLLMSPYIPLLFMGEEYGERRPFLFFVDHGDQGLLEATREGRKKEFAEFYDGAEPPDPAAESTFRNSVPDLSAADTPEGRELLDLYGRLLALRRETGGARPVEHIQVPAPLLAYRRGRCVVVANCSSSEQVYSPGKLGQGALRVRICTWAETSEFQASGLAIPAWGVVVYE